MRFSFLLAISFSFSTISSANAEGASATTPHASQFDRSKNIYIAIRADGQPGTGAKSDPYDASTAAQFDTIMDGLQANTTVSLAVGAIFFTNGLKWPDNSKGWTIKSDLHIFGNGATIKLVTYPNSWTSAAGQKHSVIGNRYYEAAVNNVVIENLTIDANWQNLGSPWTNKGVCCAFLYGSNNTYRNVHAINMYGDSASRTEGFSLAFNAANLSGGSSNCLAEKCVVESPRGDYQAGISFFGWNDNQAVPNESKPMVHCRAINNRFLGRFQSGGINLAFVKDITITGNYFHDSQGVHHDTGAADKITITNNTFDQIYGYGVDFEPMASIDRSGITILGNVFRIPKSMSGAHTYGINMDSFGRLFRNVVIKNNSFIRETTGNGSTLWRGIHARGLKGAVITDNTGDNSMEYNITGTNVSARNNRDFNGIDLPRFPKQ